MKGDEEAVGSAPVGSSLPKMKVSIRQRYAIHLLQKGLKDAAVAQLVGVRLSLLRAWKENPRFRRARTLAPTVDNEMGLLTAKIRDRSRRRWSEPETPWTLEKEDQSDE